MTAPTPRETADHIGEANEKVVDHIGDATTMIDHAGLARAIERLLPITTRNTPDYAEVSFGECQAQAMTMEPDTWLALNQLPALLSEIAALRGERDQLTDIYEATGRQCDGWIARATQAERQRDELRKALEWYGEQARLARLIHREGDAGRHALADDGGKLARALLANQGADQ